MNRLIDLHIHSNLSDGELSPKEIIDRAVNNGVSVIAIADHDTTLAYNDELFNYAKENNVKLITAVEISTRTNKCGIHVLGYNFDINNKKFTDKLYSIRNARHIYLHDVATKLKELGYIIDVDSLDKIDAVTKAHIALNIVENEDNKERAILICRGGDCSLLITADIENAAILIYDISGRKVANIPKGDVAAGDEIILPQLSSGLYIVTIKGKEYCNSFKFSSY